jgi:hypothetical protein
VEGPDVAGGSHGEALQRRLDRRGELPGELERRAANHRRAGHPASSTDEKLASGDTGSRWNTADRVFLS